MNNGEPSSSADTTSDIANSAGEMGAKSELPNDLTRFAGADRSTLEQVFKRGIDMKDWRVSRFLFDEVLAAVRRGTLDTIDKMGGAIDDVLKSDQGKILQREHPNIYAEWAILGKLLNEILFRKGPANVDFVMRAQRSFKLQILRTLNNQEPVLRDSLTHQLNADLPNHVINDLIDIGFLESNLTDGTEIALTTAGKEYVETFTQAEKRIMTEIPSTPDYSVETFKLMGDQELADTWRILHPRWGEDDYREFMGYLMQKFDKPKGLMAIDVKSHGYEALYRAMIDVS